MRVSICWSRLQWRVRGLLHNAGRIPAAAGYSCQIPSTEEKAHEPVNSFLVSDIRSQLASLTNLISNRSDKIEEKISDLNKKVECVSADLKAVSTKMACLEERVDKMEQPVRLMQKKAG